MQIDGKSRLIGLMGNPVEHTLSPVIHNEISRQMNISSVYMPFRVENDLVENAVRGAYALNVLGLNVTVPHKNAVMDYLVDVDDAAMHIGAVNTLVRDEGKHGYKGYNTDMLGLQRQIHDYGISLSGQTVVVIGAGGAAKAVVYMCLLEGANKVYILNRTLSKAEEIVRSMSLVKQIHSTTSIIALDITDVSAIKEDSVIAFQAISIGLYPNVNEVAIDSPAFYEKVKTGVDLIYTPANTMFMKLVREHGGRAYNSLKMLLYQGVAAYELWHNITVPQDIVENIYDILQQKVYTNYVLIGFMGSGKTTFGKALAKELGMDFLDTDEYIEKIEGKSIPQIFDEQGESGFREIETQTLRKLKGHIHNTVIATGGGMPLRDENRVLLKEIGTVCYLTATSEEIYDRIKDDTNRPLLQTDNPYERICTMMYDRKPHYLAACDKIIDTGSNDVKKIIKEIIR